MTQQIPGEPIARQGVPRFHRILVTGATGLLGSPLVSALTAQGYVVAGMGKRVREVPPGGASEYLYGGLAEPEASVLLRPWRWDAVIHLAGPVPRTHHELPEQYPLLAEHVSTALTVCAAIPGEWRGRFIHISGMNVYGIPQYLPVDEAHPLRPMNVYGAAKALAEQVVCAWAARERWDLWVLRICGLFTESRRSGAIYQFLAAALQQRLLTISAPVPLPWDVIHVDDAVEAIVRSLESAQECPGPVNIGYGSPVDLSSMARQIIQLTDSRSTIEEKAGVRHPPFQMDIRKAQRLLNWPPTTLEARLDRMRSAIEAQLTQREASCV